MWLCRFDCKDCNRFCGWGINPFRRFTCVRTPHTAFVTLFSYQNRVSHCVQFGKRSNNMLRRISKILGKTHMQQCLQRSFATAAVANKERPRLVDCRQGEKVVPTFSKEEMQNRVDKLRALMKDQKLEACVFTSIHNVNYFSDFLYCAFGRPYALVVTDEDLTVIGASMLFCKIIILELFLFLLHRFFYWTEFSEGH